jgi:hypothetical protein
LDLSECLCLDFAHLQSQQMTKGLLQPSDLSSDLSDDLTSLRPWNLLPLFGFMLHGLDTVIVILEGTQSSASDG